MRGFAVKRLAAGAAAVVLVLAGSVSCGGSSARIAVTPSAALLDAPVTATISGLTPGARTTVTASASDEKSQPWTATAQFTADGNGRVSLAQSSTGGSYRGANPMGLFETLAPTTPPKLTRGQDAVDFIPPFLKDFPIKLQASVEGDDVASATVTRQWGPVVEKKQTLAATGIYGHLFQPAHSVGRTPAVLVFGGSEGGLATDAAAALLAAHGYPALALAYFKEPGLPSALSNIPLEYFVKALTLLGAQPGVDPNQLLVWGTSRGSEAALLLGAHFPQLVYGVIGSVPSSVVNGSFSTNPPSSAWTLGGTPLPYAPSSDWDNPAPIDAPNAIIPVENIHAPVFLVCGGEDLEWDSCPYTDAITQRLGANTPVALKYPAAGHSVGPLMPYLPMATNNRAGVLGTSGGSPYANAQADADAWPKLLDFLTHQASQR